MVQQSLSQHLNLRNRPELQFSIFITFRAAMDISTSIQHRRDYVQASICVIKVTVAKL